MLLNCLIDNVFWVCTFAFGSLLMFCKDTKYFSGMQVIMGVNLESCFMLLIFRCEFFCGAKLWCFGSVFW